MMLERIWRTKGVHCPFSTVARPIHRRMLVTPTRPIIIAVKNTSGGVKRWKIRIWARLPDERGARSWRLVQGEQAVLARRDAARCAGPVSSLIIGLILAQLAKKRARIPRADQDVPASSPVVGAAIRRRPRLRAESVRRRCSPPPHRAWRTSWAAGGRLLRAVVGAELGTLIAGKPRLDLIAVPIVTLVSGGLIAIWSPRPSTRPASCSASSKWRHAEPIPMGVILTVIFGWCCRPIPPRAGRDDLHVPAGPVMGPGLLLAAGAATSVLLPMWASR